MEKKTGSGKLSINTANRHKKWSFKSDEQEGLWECFDEEEQLHYRGNYKEVIKQDSWEKFDESGNLTKTEEYKDGILQE